MGFRTGSYAKVWDVTTVNDSHTKLRISISRKNSQTGEYEDEFSGIVSCFGTAVAKQAMLLKKGDRIKLGDVDVTNRYDKEKNTNYHTYKVFSFEAEGGANQPTAAAPRRGHTTVDSGEAPDLPY